MCPKLATIMKVAPLGRALAKVATGRAVDGPPVAV
jgi:hypothetical protein